MALECFIGEKYQIMKIGTNICTNNIYEERRVIFDLNDIIFDFQIFN